MNGVLICAGEGEKKNIGDYIQSVAQEQFYEHTDCYVEREHLDTFQAKEKVNVIMNAWFMWHPENFPPSDIIHPLFISFHLVPKIADIFFTSQTISYLKKYEPIGARDIGTQKLLEQHGIRSYFSGCLTLTLGLKFKTDKHNENSYFVDPFYNIIGLEEGFGKIHRFFIALKIFICNCKTLYKLKKIFVPEFTTGFARHSKTISDWLCCLSFYNTYSKVFDDDILLNSTYLSHNVPQSLFRNDNEKMEYAKELIKKYASAKLVVTSRLHCALPCLGLETPMIFITSENLENGIHRGGSSGRFDGLTNLTNTLFCNKQELYAYDNYMKVIIQNKIKRTTIIKNPDTFIQIKNDLINRIKSWFNSSVEDQYTD